MSETKISEPNGVQVLMFWNGKSHYETAVLLLNDHLPDLGVRPQVAHKALGRQLLGKRCSLVLSPLPLECS